MSIEHRVIGGLGFLFGVVVGNILGANSNHLAAVFAAFVVGALLVGALLVFDVIRIQAGRPQGE